MKHFFLQTCECVKICERIYLLSRSLIFFSVNVYTAGWQVCALWRQKKTNRAMYGELKHHKTLSRTATALKFGGCNPLSNVLNLLFTTCSEFDFICHQIPIQTLNYWRVLPARQVGLQNRNKKYRNDFLWRFNCSYCEETFFPETYLVTSCTFHVFQ